MIPGSAKPPGLTRKLSARALGNFLLAGWTIGILVVGSFLMAGHIVALPTPAAASQRVESRPTLPQEPRRWSARHVLYQSCGCSGRVLQHLLSRRGSPDLDESILYVHDQDATEKQMLDVAATATDAERAGFRFQSVTPVELERRFHVESAPLLTVFDASGQTRYVGGYTDRSGAGLIHDLDTIAKLRAGDAAKSLPVFGCAVSRRVKQALDPLGLKYPTAKTTGLE